jgi:hypothetical protein
MNLFEALSGPFSDNFVYIPPSDFKQLIADFYGLTGCAGQVSVSDSGETHGSYFARLMFNIWNAYEVNVQALQQWMITAMPYLCAVEFRHIHSEGALYLKYVAFDDSKFNKQLKILMRELVNANYSRRLGRGTTTPAIHDFGRGPTGKGFKNITSMHSKKYNNYAIDDTGLHPELKGSYKFIDDEYNKNNSPRDTENQINYYKFFVNHFGSIEGFMNFAEEAFGKQGLWEESFGGQPWVDIVKFWKRLKKVKGTRDTAHIIDLIIDLQHNTGSAFNKVGHIHHDTTFKWLDRFLDEKAQYPTPYGYIDKMSPKVRLLVQAFYYHRHGLSRELHDKLVGHHEKENKLGAYDVNNYRGSWKPVPHFFVPPYKRIDYYTIPSDYDKPSDQETLNNYEKYKHMIMSPYQIKKKEEN